jgi:DNA-binding XRE family transcriptional regulator
MLSVKVYITISISMYTLTKLETHSRLKGRKDPEREVCESMSTLREIREYHLLSRKALADLADVSESTIERMEEGKGHPTGEIIDKVLKALGEKIGEKLTTENVQGLKEEYNIMRDRKQRRKASMSSSG